MKNKEKIILAAFALLLVTVLSGCGDRYRQKQPVTEIYAEGADRVYSEIVSLGRGRAAVSYWNVPGDAEECSGNLTVEIMNVVTGEIECSREFGEECCVEDRTFRGGLIAVYDFGKQEYLFYNRRLKLTGTLSVPGGAEGKLSFDMKSIYYVESEHLYRYDVETGKSSMVLLEGDMHVLNINSIQQERELLELSVYTDEYSSDSCSAIVDGTTGKFLMLGELLGETEFCGDSFMSRRFELSESEEDYSCRNCAVYGRLDGSEVYTISESELSSEPYVQSNWIAVSGSEYFTCDVWVGSSASNSFTDLYRAGETVERCSIKAGGVLIGCTYLPEEDLIAACLLRDNDTAIVVIDPRLLEFETVGTASKLSGEVLMDGSVISGYTESLRLPELPEELAAVRGRADILERQYGVTILLSAECERPGSHSGYDITLTCDSGGNEAEDINHALDEIEKSLALYPDGYFAQMKNSAGEGGVRILLTGEMYGETSAIGVSYTYGEWQNIAVNIYYADNLIGTMCHEFWHVTENWLTAEAESEFYDGTWDAINPDGVDYLYDYHTENYENMQEFTFWGEWRSENVYYVDGYARTFPSEDRARIMEYVMSDEGAADLMMECPALRQKMEIIARAIRAGYDTDGWENVWWERYFDK